MRISDWSSDVCSSDLCRTVGAFRSHRGALPQKRTPKTEGGNDIAGRSARDDLWRYRFLKWANLMTAERMLRSWPLFSIRSIRSAEHTSELQSLMRLSYAVFCLKKTKIKNRYLHCGHS